MKFRFNLIPLILFLMCLELQAQEQSGGSSVDTTYIDILPGYWSLRAYTGQRYQNIGVINGKGDGVSYRPNSNRNVGVGFTYKSLVVDFGIGIGSSDEYNTESFDFQGKLFFRQSVIGMTLQNYQGFELRSNTESASDFREDIETRTLGLTYSHLFGNDKLSLRSAYVGNQIQRKSKGSFLIASYFNWHRFDADSSLVPPLALDDFNLNAGFFEKDIVNFGTGIGYSYIVVLPKGFFIFANVSPSIGLQFGSQESEDSSIDPPLFPNYNLAWGAAGGYANKKFYISLSLTNTNNLNRIEAHNTYVFTSGKAKLVFGYRLGSRVGILDDLDEKIPFD